MGTELPARTWQVADKHGDAQMCDFVEGELLQEQVEAVKKARRGGGGCLFV